MIADAIDSALAAHGFKNRDSDDYRAAGFPRVWLRQTFNTNRAVALWTPPAGVTLAAGVHPAKWERARRFKHWSSPMLFVMGKFHAAITDALRNAGFADASS